MSHGNDHLHRTHTAEEFEHELVAHDEWFRHDASEPRHKEAHGGTNTWIINTFFFATVIFVAVTGRLVMSLFKWDVNRVKVAQQEQIPISTEARNLRAEWDSRLHSYQWADAQAGRVRVPIEAAEQIVINEYRAAAQKK